MTKREAAIVSAHTGILIGEFSAMAEYVSEIVGHGVFDVNLANECRKHKDEILQDFNEICVENWE